MVALETIRREVAEVARRNRARRVVLFGSHARGTATERSDVDLIVVESTQDRFLDRLARYADDLGDRLDACVEVLVYTPEELARIEHRPFIQRILREGILLYESGED